MTWLTLTILVNLLSIYVLWLLYVFTMTVARVLKDGKVTRPAFFLALPAAIFVFILDVFLNYTILAILTLDFPKKGEYTFSKRLERLSRQIGWRKSLAVWLAENLLDPYDPTGKHIK